jgi:hypothetical protein
VKAYNKTKKKGNRKKRKYTITKSAQLTAALVDEKGNITMIYA